MDGPAIALLAPDGVRQRVRPEKGTDAQGESELVELCRRLHPRLSGSIALLTGDAGVGEELAQEALVRVWERWDRVRQLDAPEAWAYRVGLNLARSWGRRLAAERRARARRGHEPDRSWDADADESVAVRAAVRRLPRRQREVIACRYFLDLSVAETALAMRCAEGTVKSLTSQASATLRGLLAEERAS